MRSIDVFLPPSFLQKDLIHDEDSEIAGKSLAVAKRFQHH